MKQPVQQLISPKHRSKLFEGSYFKFNPMLFQNLQKKVLSIQIGRQLPRQKQQRENSSHHLNNLPYSVQFKIKLIKFKANQSRQSILKDNQIQKEINLKKMTKNNAQNKNGLTLNIKFQQLQLVKQTSISPNKKEDQNILLTSIVINEPAATITNNIPNYTDKRKYQRKFTSEKLICTDHLQFMEQSEAKNKSRNQSPQNSLKQIEEQSKPQTKFRILTHHRRNKSDRLYQKNKLKSFEIISDQLKQPIKNLIEQKKSIEKVEELNESSEDEGLFKPDELKAKAIEFLQMSDHDKQQSQQGYLQGLDQRTQLISVTNQTPNYQQYIETFRNYQKLSDLSNYFEIKSNICIQMSKTLEEKQILPKNLNFFDTNLIRAQNIIDVTGLLTSDSYVDLFTSGLSSSNYSKLEVLKLGNNELDSKKLTKIVKNLPISLIEIDLKQNNLCSISLKCLGNFLQQKNSKQINYKFKFTLQTYSLKILNLENNQLGDQNIILFCSLIHDNSFISQLNLSKNNITDLSTNQLAKYIRKSVSLQELYLHFNSIGANGGSQLFKGVFKNQYLKVLDMSFNCLGNQESMESVGVHELYKQNKNNIQQHYNKIKNINSVLHKPHPYLQHLDLSHNGYSYQDAKLIQQGLQFNQILFGLHFAGNEGNFYINTRGSLVNQDEWEQAIKFKQNEYLSESDGYENLHLQKKNSQESNYKQNNFQRINSCNPVQDNKFNKNGDCCWICQDWQVHEFKWIPGLSGSLKEDPIFLHFDFEDWRPMIMNHGQDGIFRLSRMVPPNIRIRYFFSNPALALQVSAKDQQSVETNVQYSLYQFIFKIFEVIHQRGVPLLYADDTFTYSHQVYIVNQIFVNKNKQLIDPLKFYLNSSSVKPREPERIWDINPLRAEDRKWSVEQSIFTQFLPDSENHLNSCLDFDLECGKIISYMTQPEEVIDLKNVLRKYYTYLIQAFNFYSSRLIDSDFPVIDFQAFKEFLSQTTIISKKYTRQVDVDINFLSTQLVQKEIDFKYVKQNHLIRYQFIEMIIRISREQYQRTGRLNTLAKCLENLLQNYQVLHVIKQFGVSQEWRDRRYWTQIMDMAINYKMQILQLLFDATSRFSPKKSQNKYILFKDFNELFIKSGLSDSKIKDKDLYLIFQQSMMTQVNQVSSNRHTQMNLIEFIEALNRVAEKISPSSPCHSEKNLSFRLRVVLPLFVKFEGLDEYYQLSLFKFKTGLLFILYMRLKSYLIQSYGINHKLFKFRNKLIRDSVLQTFEAKKQGVFKQKSSEEDDPNSAILISDEIDKFSTQQNHLQNVEQTIQSLLIMNDNGLMKELMVNDVFETNTQHTQPDSALLDSPINKSTQAKWDFIKELSRQRGIQKQMSGLGTVNLMRSVDHFEKINNLVEAAEIGESTPLSKIQIKERQAQRSTFNKSKFSVQAVKYDEEIL